MFRYIIRPQGISSTPRRLKELFNAQRTLRYPYAGVRRANRSRDFFLAYPPLETLEDSHAFTETEQRNYQSMRRLYNSNKPTQREILRIFGFPTPRSVGNSEPSSNGIYIARPFRHSGGRGYRLLRADPQENFELLSSWNPTQEYLQEFYPKEYEYRIIIVRGDPIITLIKRHPGISNLLPWNHSNGSSFVTVTNISNNRLRHTNVYEIIEQNQEFFRGIDLCALDVLVNLYHHQPYVISEINFCPSLTIESNLERIRHAFNSRV